MEWHETTVRVNEGGICGSELNTLTIIRIAMKFGTSAQGPEINSNGFNGP